MDVPPEGSGPASPATPATSAAVDMLRNLCDVYANRRPVTSVAVVGNAPVEPSDERAELIDSCALVFRVNGFALDGPGRPRSVGARVDVVAFTRGVRATPWFLESYRDRLYLLIEPGRMHWEPEIIPDWWPPDLGFVPVPNREIAVPLSHALGLDLIAQPHWATTGTMTAWLARTLYPDADLHMSGFSVIERPDQTAWEHAYGEACAISPEHMLERESALIRQWIDAGQAIWHR